MKESRTSTRKVKAAIREAEAVRLRLEGASYREIADLLGYQGPSGAFRAVERGLSKLCPVERIELLRRMELSRLDRLMRALWPKALQGDYGAIDRVLAIMARRAKLLGLDAPAKASFVTPNGEKPLRLVDLFPADMSKGGVNGNGNKSRG